MSKDNKDHLKNFLSSVMESAMEDMEKIQVAKNSFYSIKSYINQLNGNLEGVFNKTKEGYFAGFALGSRIRNKEHLKLSIFFFERKTFGIKKTLKAQAGRVRVQPENTNSSQIKGYRISIFFDAPEEETKTIKKYNSWLSRNLDNILESPGVFSSYIHEFVHVLDFKRIHPNVLLKRTNKKESEISSGLSDYKNYVNDPLELNAYFLQGVAQLEENLETLYNNQNIVELNKIINNSPQEFADMFFREYIKPQVKKNLSQENFNRFYKRISKIREFLISKYL